MRKKIDFSFRNKYIEQSIQKYFKKKKIDINLDGINEVIHRYYEHEDIYLDELYDLIRDVILWINYLEDLHAVIEYHLEQNKLKQDILSAEKTLEKDDVYLKGSIDTIKTHNKNIMLFLKNIEKGITFFKIAHRECTYTYKQAINNYKFKSSDY